MTNHGFSGDPEQPPGPLSVLPRPEAAGPATRPGLPAQRGGPGRPARAEQPRGSLLWLIGGLGAFTALAVVATVGVVVLARYPGPAVPAAFPTLAPHRAAAPSPTAVTPAVGSRLPPLPGQAAPVTRAHPLYRVGALPAVDCPARRTRDAADMHRLFLAVGACLDRAWRPVLARAGLPWRSPRYRLSGTPVKGPCGSFPNASGAMYCGDNATIYLDVALMRRTQNGVDYRLNEVYTSVLAHEYGHHVQQLTGVMTGYGRQWAKLADWRTRNPLTRRLELQANCFSGLFVAAVADSYPIDARQRRRVLWNQYHIGDDHLPASQRDHGSYRHSGQWFQRGLDRGRLDACDTWSPSPRSVD